MRTALISSPRSRKNRRDPGLAERVLGVMPQGSDLYSARTMIEMAQAAGDCQLKGVTCVYLLGGDGTHRVAIDALVTAYGESHLPRLVFLRGGTMNTMASGLGIPRRSPESLAARAASGQARTIVQPLLRIDDTAGPHYGFLFGTGAIYQFLAEYLDTENPTPLHSAATLGKTLLEAAGLRKEKILRRQHVSLCVDSQPATHNDVLCIAAGTIEHMGFGFRPFRGVVGTSGTFGGLSLFGPIADVPRMLWDLRLGRNLSARMVEHFQCQSMTLTQDNHEAIAYQIDGDLMPASPHIRVQRGPVITLVV